LASEKARAPRTSVTTTMSPAIALLQPQRGGVSPAAAQE
jgi:hypothetical protein